MKLYPRNNQIIFSVKVELLLLLVFYLTKFYIGINEYSVLIRDPWDLM